MTNKTSDSDESYGTTIGVFGIIMIIGALYLVVHASNNYNHTVRMKSAQLCMEYRSNVADLVADDMSPELIDTYWKSYPGIESLETRCGSAKTLAVLLADAPKPATTVPVPVPVPAPPSTGSTKQLSPESGWKMPEGTNKDLKALLTAQGKAIANSGWDAYAADIAGCTGPAARSFWEWTLEGRKQALNMKVDVDVVDDEAIGLRIWSSNDGWSKEEPIKAKQQPDGTWIITSTFC